MRRIKIILINLIHFPWIVLDVVVWIFLVILGRKYKTYQKFEKITKNSEFDISLFFYSFIWLCTRLL